MSKVEVKKGDTWHVRGGILWQRRGPDWRPVASFHVNVTSWVEVIPDNGATTVACQVARAWIESLGGTVVEEREEEKVGEVTLHVYHHPFTGQVFMFKETAHGLPVGKYLGTHTIHIAGVTT